MRNSAYIVACIGVMAVLCAHPGELWAAKDQRVVITSEPSGATVWIDDRSSDPVGTTPWEGTLPEGRHTVFLELQGHEFVVQEINVKRRRRGKQRFSYELVELRYGSIDVLAASGSPDADGAKVLIDGKEVGTVPDTFEAPEGAHQVEVVKDGYKRFENWVEVAKGESVEVNVALEALGAGDAVATTNTSTEDKDDPGPSITKPPPKAKSGPSPVVLAVGMGAGWRRFDFDEDQANVNLRDYTADGIGLVDIGAEFRVGALVSALDWLSIFGGASLSLPLTSTTNDVPPVPIDTSWFRREIGMRAQVGLGPGALGLDVAEVGSAFTFDTQGAELAGQLPEAIYEYLRAGIAYRVHSGGNAFGAGGDGLIMLSSTGVSDSLDSASSIGFRAHGWYRRRLFSGLEAALTGSFTQFSYVADGYDRMFDVIVSGGYSF